jgi:hypothetical protein
MMDDAHKRNIESNEATRLETIREEEEEDG